MKIKGLRDTKKNYSWQKVLYMQKLCGWREHCEFEGTEVTGAETKEKGADAEMWRKVQMQNMWSYPESKGKEWGGHREQGKKVMELKLLACSLHNLRQDLSLPLSVCGFPFIHNGDENDSAGKINPARTPTTLA